MARSEIDIKQLRAFVSVASEQSFTGAAKTLRCTQGTISSRIRTLEDQLGVRLFDRARFNIRLTPAGNDLFGGAKALLERHDQLFTRAQSKKISGTVRLGMAEGFGTPIVSRLLRRIRTNYAALQINLYCDLSCTLQRMAEAGDLDLALVGLMEEAPGATILSRPRLQWIGSNDFEFEDGAPIPLASYPEECPVRTSVYTTLQEQEVPFVEVLRTLSDLVLVNAVRSGCAIAAMPENLVPRDLKVLIRPSLLPPLERAKIQLLQMAGLDSEAAQVVRHEIVNVYRGR